MAIRKWSKLGRIEKAKVVLDIIFVIFLISLVFVRMTLQFGYLQVYLYSYVVQDSTEDLGFQIAKPGNECLDVVFLNSCDFFTRLFVSSIIFSFFHLLSIIFAVLCIVNILTRGHKGSNTFNSWWVHYLYPLFFIIGFSVLVFYGRLFEDEIVGVEGKFNLRYLEGTYIIWASLANSLISLGTYSLNERSLEESKVLLLPN